MDREAIALLGRAGYADKMFESACRVVALREDWSAANPYQGNRHREYGYGLSHFGPCGRYMDKACAFLSEFLSQDSDEKIILSASFAALR